MAAQGMIENENDSAQAARFQSVLEQIKVAAGIQSLFLVSHTGWSANGRTRGSSQWEGWPDCLWTFTSEKDDFRTPRYLSAWGRDGIDLQPIELIYKDGGYSWDGLTKGQSQQDWQMQGFLDQIRCQYEEQGVWPKASDGDLKNHGKLLKRAIDQELLEMFLGERIRGQTPKRYKLTKSGRAFLDAMLH
jgi:hypothetical protein